MQNVIDNAQEMIKAERALYIQLHTQSMALSQRTNQHFLYGVPMH